MKLENNNKLNELTNSHPLEYENFDITDVSSVINEELDKCINHLKQQNDINKNNI